MCKNITQRVHGTADYGLVELHNGCSFVCWKHMIPMAC